MAMKGYFILPIAPKLEPHHKIRFSVTPWTSLFFEKRDLTPLKKIQSLNSSFANSGRLVMSLCGCMNVQVFKRFLKNHFFIILVEVFKLVRDYSKSE